MGHASNIVDIHELRRSCGHCGLQQLCLPASIGNEDLSKLDTIVKQRRPVDRGTILFHENNAFTSLYVVRSGSFKTHTSMLEGDVQIIGFHLPGEIIGLDALGTDQHQCTVEALERSSVCEVPFSQLSDVATQVAGLQRQLYRVMSREFIRDQEHLIMMGRKQAQARLAIFLRSLSDRFHKLGHDPHEFTLSMSRQDLGNYLGLVVETVSRLFTKFQTQRIIEVNRKLLRIIDPAALAAIAEHSEQDEGVRAAS